MEQPKSKLISRIALIGLTLTAPVFLSQCSHPHYYGGGRINNLYVPKELRNQDQAPAQVWTENQILPQK